jgi:hypothetical protein
VVAVAWCAVAHEHRRRVAAAEQEVKRYQADHGRELLDELEPHALKIRDRIVRLVGELVTADGDWAVMVSRVNELVMAMPGADPRRDVPERHELAGAIRELRKAADAVQVLTPPLPTFAGRAARERNERRPSSSSFAANRGSARTRSGRSRDCAGS